MSILQAWLAAKKFKRTNKKARKQLDKKRIEFNVKKKENNGSR